jgi:hypothetical protein
MSHMTLKAYYESSFAMMQHHKYSLTELENMMPWERDIYQGLLIQHLQKEKEEMEKQSGR